MWGSGNAEFPSQRTCAKNSRLGITPSTFEKRRLLERINEQDEEIKELQKELEVAKGAEPVKSQKDTILASVESAPSVADMLNENSSSHINLKQEIEVSEDSEPEEVVDFMNKKEDSPKS